jgi:prevent-host-death family protein
MEATARDLRFHTKKILDTAIRGEEVIITYHGKPYAKIIPIAQSEQTSKQNDFCGMWKDRKDLSDVDDYIGKIRKRRTF